MRLIHIPDLHFGGNAISMIDPAERLGHQVNILKKALKQIRTLKPTGIVFNGDTFDIPNPNGVVVTRFLECLSELDCPLYFNLGNHEVEELNSPHALDYIRAAGVMDKRIKVIDKETTLDHHGTDITFLPWPLHSTESTAKLVFCHTEYCSAKWDNGRIAGDEAPTFDHKSANEKKQIWISGHIHTGQALYGKRLQYSGSLYTTKALGLIDGELRPHNIFVIRKDGEEIKISPIRFDADFHLVSVKNEPRAVKDIVAILEQRYWDRQKYTIMIKFDPMGLPIPNDLARFASHLVIGSVTGSTVQKNVEVKKAPSEFVPENIHRTVFSRICKKFKLNMQGKIRLRRIMVTHAKSE